MPSHCRLFLHTILVILAIPDMPAMRTMRISPMKASPVVVTLFSCDLALL